MPFSITDLYVLHEKLHYFYILNQPFCAQNANANTSAYTHNQNVSHVPLYLLFSKVAFTFYSTRK